MTKLKLVVNNEVPKLKLVWCEKRQVFKPEQPSPKWGSYTKVGNVIYVEF